MTESPVKNDHIDVAALVTVVEHCPDGAGRTVAQALVRMLMAGARQTGFWNGEIMPPAYGADTWRLVQRFRTAEQLQAWEHSGRRAALVDELVASTGQVLKITKSMSEKDDSGVATAILTDVRAGMEEQYFEWEQKIQIAQSKFEGYRGVYFQPPLAGQPGPWATLLRFDSPESLNKWFISEERHNLLKESEKFVKATRFRAVSTSFPGWVPLDAQTGKPPANWKTALLVVLGLFPIVILEMRFLSPFLSGLNRSLSAFISMIGSVAGTTFVTMPLFVKTFGWWLYPSENDAALINAKGTFLLIALFALEVGAFWNLFAP